jgi:hypothetical protein
MGTTFDWKTANGALAEQMQGWFVGWTSAMLEARVNRLEEWSLLEVRTQGDCNYFPDRYGEAPYVDGGDPDNPLNSIWGIDRELARRDRDGEE